MTYECGSYILRTRLHPWWSWPPQGYRRLYPASVNWWVLGVGPLAVIWCPIRSQAYLRRRRAQEGS